ncbi:hypothetical protein ADP8_05077 [Roseomonas mucosa]|nr:hypothetical protein ADP8_05077 [Roseomonas mucosa]
MTKDAVARLPILSRHRKGTVREGGAGRGGLGNASADAAGAQRDRPPGDRAAPLRCFLDGAKGSGFEEASLTTCRHLPFNASFCRRPGLGEVPETVTRGG